jgi:MoaA/NifB/PqqE/SkfB family radical SAM enzyme
MGKLGFVQVEVSTKCQLNCLMCPRSCFKDEWISKDMDLNTFTLIPFKRFRYAHLQGWGEPLLNPNIDEMIEMARKHCKVGLTTNGLLIERYLGVVLKLDLLSVSVASANPLTHHAVRGFNLEKLKRNIKLVSESRKAKSKPKIVIATMMLKNTIETLPRIVDFALECGADEVIANNLDYIPSQSLIGQEVFGLQSNQQVEEILDQIKMKAKDAGIRFVAKQVVMDEALVCAENPVDNCLITVDGKIAPCVYLHLPTRSDYIVRHFRGKRVEVPKVYFGSITQWRKSDIRVTFEKRLQVLYQYLPLELPALPDVCRSCYKAWSV